ncbi:MAG: FHA domain-containing protein [Gallionella sp.]|nr:FHA domain-containing protein [Gallionella sp.]MDD4959454.1 FHA domain-containing protein [Gallionella sp.]
MKRLAWIEILNQHGDVTVRHPVYSWPVNIGRAYHNDVMLDDPYIAAGHLEIQPENEGGYQLNVLGGINAMTINRKRERHQSAKVSPEDIIHIGKTAFRIRPVDYNVSPDKPLPRKAMLRNALGLFVGISLVLFEYVISRWLNYDREEKLTILAVDMMDMIPWQFGLTWVGFWAIIGRIEVGRPHFIEHATLATLGAGVLMLIGDMSSYVAFALDSSLLSYLLHIAVVPFIFGLIIYRHLCLASRINHRMIGFLVAGVVILGVNISDLKDKWRYEDDLAQMTYSRTIGSPAMVLTPGQTPAEFIANTKKLKTIVDE